MRIIVGLMFACHGAQKLLGWFAKPNKPAAPLDASTMIAGSIELVGGLMIAVGLLAFVAAFLASGLMAFAYFKVHAAGMTLDHAPSTAERFFPLLNQGEPAVLYCFVFLYIFFRGSGPLSLDSLIWGRTTPPDAVGGPMRTGRDL